MYFDTNGISKFNFCVKMCDNTMSVDAYVEHLSYHYEHYILNNVIKEDTLLNMKMNIIYKPWTTNYLLIFIILS